MTLAIGMISKEGFVLASDSRMSSDVSLNDSVEKIFGIGDKIAVGIAGDGMVATHLFDLMSQDKTLDLDAGIHRIAEQVCLSLSTSYDRYYPGVPFKLREPLEILLAGYSKDDKPHLYILSYDDNFIPRQCLAGHNSIGVAHISEYILNRIYEKDKMSSKNAARLSVFCIKETISQSQKVGGKIKVGTLSNKSRFTLLPNPEIKEMVIQCGKVQSFHRGRFYPEEIGGVDRPKAASEKPIPPSE